MNATSILFSIFTTLIGIVASIIITKAFSKAKKPTWYYKLNVLVNEGLSEIEDLKITYKDCAVDNLSSVYLAFWNNGKETIMPDDVVEKICFCVDAGYNIWNAQIISETNKSNEFQVILAEDRRSVEITFRYIDYKQGVVIQLLSDCDKKGCFEMQGALMGCRSFKYEARRKRHRLLGKVGVGMFVSAYLFCALLGTKYPLLSMIYILIVLTFLMTFSMITKIEESTEPEKQSDRSIPKELKKCFLSFRGNE